MDAVKAMDLIEQLEVKMGQMYARLVKLFGDDAELSEMFGHLQEEEANHAHLAAMQKRIVRSRPADFGEVHLNFSDYKQALDYIDVVMSMPRDRVQEILVQCYLIESSMVEQYVVAALRGNDEIRPMLEALTEGFRDHLTALIARVQQMGVDIRNVAAIRKLPRIIFAEKVTINDKVFGKSVDVSESGIFVLTTQMFPVNAVVTVSFPMAGGVVTTKAVVRYTVPNAGLGLNFKELPEKGLELIQQHVEKALARVGNDTDRHTR